MLQFKSLTTAAKPRKRVPSRSNARKAKYPQHCLIGLALMSSSNGEMQVGEIYKFVEMMFPCVVQSSPRTWKNSLRHSLSLSGYFEKANLDGQVVDAFMAAKKNNRWRIIPDKASELLEKVNTFKEDNSSLFSFSVSNAGYASSLPSYFSLTQAEISQLQQFWISQLQVANQLPDTCLVGETINTPLSVQPPILTSVSQPSLSAPTADECTGLDYTNSSLADLNPDESLISSQSFPSINGSLSHNPLASADIQRHTSINTQCSLEQVLGQNKELDELPEIDFDVSEFLNNSDVKTDVDQTELGLKDAAKVDVSALLDQMFPSKSPDSSQNSTPSPNDHCQSHCQPELVATSLELPAIEDSLEMNADSIFAPLSTNQDIDALLNELFEDSSLDNEPIGIVASIASNPSPPTEGELHAPNCQTDETKIGEPDHEMEEDITRILKELLEASPEETHDISPVSQSPSLPFDSAEPLPDLESLLLELTYDEPRITESDVSITGISSNDVCSTVDLCTSENELLLSELPDIDVDLKELPDQSFLDMILSGEEDNTVNTLPAVCSILNAPKDSSSCRSNHSSPQLHQLGKRPVKIAVRPSQRPRKPSTLFEVEKNMATTSPLLGKRRLLPEEDSPELKAKKLKRMNEATNLRKAMIKLSSTLRRKCKQPLPHTPIAKGPVEAAGLCSLSRKRAHPDDNDSEELHCAKKQKWSVSKVITPTCIVVHKLTPS